MRLICVRQRCEQLLVTLAPVGPPPRVTGRGGGGWVSIDLAAGDRPSADVLCDWVEESYRAIAPKKLVKQLDEARATRPG